MLFVARSHYDHERVDGKPALPFRLALDLVSSFLSLSGEPCPSLYKLEGRVTCGVQIGLGLAYLLLQAG